MDRRSASASSPSGPNRDPRPLFFFQAEDGIRYLTVTGVQTCALPIYNSSLPSFSSCPSPQITLFCFFSRVCCFFRFDTKPSIFSCCKSSHSLLSLLLTLTDRKSVV